nr:hypothetical protein [Tanacetum cinerariifolium]
METKDTLSLCSNSEAQQMQQIQDKVKKSCMVSFRKLHSHLKRLSQNNLQGSRTESRFKRAFTTLSGQDIETFTGTMFFNMEQMEKQIDREDFQEIGSMAAFKRQSFRWKPMSQSHRNQSVVRKPIAFKSERPRISKPRCVSQVDVHNDLLKPVTTHYLPKETEVASAKPHHMIASGNSRISLKNMPRFSSNNMVYDHYLEEAKKRTQERSRNSEPSMIPSARLQSTANGSKPKPRINNQTSRN